MMSTKPREAPEQTSGNEARDQGAPTRQQDQQDQHHGRSTIEWITLAISATIVIGLIVLVTYIYFTSSDAPAVIDVQPRVEDARADNGRYYLPIEITNTGGATAEDVRVEVSLMLEDGSSESSEITIMFLAGNASANAIVVFQDDPSEGEVTVDVISYLHP